jgi:AraC-like DNA-binding protein
MLYEPSTLASLAALLATALREEYDIDPQPIYAAAGIPLEPPASPQLRYPLTDIRKLWQLAREASGDEAIGLKTGFYAKPTQFYAFGYSWLASATLLGGLKRLTRYYKLLSTASVEVNLRETPDAYALSAVFPEESKSPPKEGIDCGMTALLTLCDIIAEKEIRPLRVELICPSTVHPEAYRQALRAPITFDADVGTFYFDKETFDAQLPGAAPDIAKATDKIAEHYIETLDPHKVASHVRRLLINLLPSGKTDQNVVASRLNRSASTLQRQLQDEGLSYRDVLESTRRTLAEEYLNDKKHSHAQIAYLLGFSDQSNFSRAFKRWTSMSPRAYQDARDGGA